MTRQRALAAQKANYILGCIKTTVASRSREGILLLCSGETPPGFLCPALEPSAQERQGPVGAGPEEATKMIRGLEHLCCEERLRAGAVQLKEEKAPGRPYCGLPVPEGAYKKAGEGLFTRVWSDRT